MKSENTNRTRRIICRLTVNEYDKIEKKWKASTCRKLSDYLRRHLFEKPIVTTYRNRSLDDFMAEMMKLRAELNSLGNNFNQAVKKLHTLQQIDEFRRWLVSWETDRKTLLQRVDLIKEEIGKMSDKWLQ